MFLLRRCVKGERGLARGLEGVGPGGHGCTSINGVRSCRLLDTLFCASTFHCHDFRLFDNIVTGDIQSFVFPLFFAHPLYYSSWHLYFSFCLRRCSSVPVGSLHRLFSPFPTTSCALNFIAMIIQPFSSLVDSHRIYSYPRC